MSSSRVCRASGLALSETLRFGFLRSVYADDRIASALLLDGGMIAFGFSFSLSLPRT